MCISSKQINVRSVTDLYLFHSLAKSIETSAYYISKHNLFSVYCNLKYKFAYFNLFTAGNLFLVENTLTDGQSGKKGTRCEDD